MITGLLINLFFDENGKIRTAWAEVAAVVLAVAFFMLLFGIVAVFR